MDLLNSINNIISRISVSKLSTIMAEIVDITLELGDYTNWWVLQQQLNNATVSPGVFKDRLDKFNAICIKKGINNEKQDAYKQEALIMFLESRRTEESGTYIVKSIYEIETQIEHINDALKIISEKNSKLLLIRTSQNLQDIYNRVKNYVINLAYDLKLQIEEQMVFTKTNSKGENTMASVFLSHSSKDKFFVRELAERLENNGVKVWLDEAELNVGDSLTEKIGKAIMDTDFVCAILSHNSINSNWVQKELELALNQEFSGKKIKVLPILLEPVDIPPFLKDKLYADFSTPQKYKENYPKILKALGLIDRKTVEIRKEGTIFEKTTRLNNLENLELNEFVDIKIVEFDENKSYNPDKNKALYNIYLKLSNTPTFEWKQIFEGERRFPRHTMWRNAWIEGDYIIVYCVPDEIEKYHLNDLKQDVTNTNVKYRQYLKEKADKELRELKIQREEKQNLVDIKGRLEL